MTGLLVSLFVACDDDEDGPTDPTAPNIATLTPDEGPVGTTVVIAGTNFGTGATVSFGGTAVTPTNPSDVSLTVEVPTGLSGEVNVTVTSDGQTSNQQTFEVTEGDVPEPPTSDVTTVADTVATIDSLSSLTAALQAASLVEALDNEDASFTVFAPVNAAFDSLLSEQGVETLDDLVEALTVEGVSGILQAHVVADSLPADLLTDPSYPTLNDGSTIAITTEGDNVFANGAQVIAANITAGNGVIHIIDSVINVDASPAVEEEEGTVRVESSEEGVGDVTWTSNNTYILDGFVYVNDGQTLTIEPGTVIKGRPGQAARASALIVARGGTIIADGTADNPIIFTAERDDLAGAVADDAQGLWGGVIILGNAPTNNNDTDGVKSIEGIPTDEERGEYGGDDATDDSGSFTYVSIRHGGSVIGGNNEINGLSLGAVGSGTTIDHVEVWANADDGIEFFGGTVNATNLVVAYCGDDGLDADEGYVGNIQNAVVWQTSETITSPDPRAMELDGGVDTNETVEPFSTPVLANITLFYDDGENNLDDAFVLRDNSGASLYNSIAINHDASVALERIDAIESSYDRYEAGTVVISGNTFYNVNGVTDAANFADLFVLDNEGDATLEAEVEGELAELNNVTDPGFGTGATKFTPTTDLTGGIVDLPQEDGLAASTYVGAVDPAADSPYFANWSKMWSVISQ